MEITARAYAKGAAPQPTLRRFDRAEPAFGQFAQARDRHIADRDDRHVVRAVPAPIKRHEVFGLERLDPLQRSDREPIRVARSGKEHPRMLVEHPPGRTATEALFLDHHAAFALDRLRLERDRCGPLLHHLKRRLQRALLLQRNVESIHRLVEAGVGVNVRAESDAQTLQESHQLVLAEALGAVERHVLQIVRQPALVVGFQDTAGVDDQPQHGATLRVAVAQQEVVHTVGEGAALDPVVERERIVGFRPATRGDRKNRQERCERCEHDAEYA